MSVVLIAIIVTSSLHCHVTSGSDDVDFKPYDCYRDVCMSRRQFCSDSEQRCKHCQQAYCLDPKTAPTQCRPLCAEWASPSSSTERLPTTGVGTTTGTSYSGGRSPFKSSGDPNEFLSTEAGTREKGIVVSPWLLYVGLSVFLVVMVVVLALLMINLACIYRLRSDGRRRRAAPSSPGEEGGVGVTEEEEEGQVLLGGEGWGSKSSKRSGRMVGGTSRSTMSSDQPPKMRSASTPPKRFCHHQTTQESKSVQTDPTLPAPLHPARSASQLCLSERRDAVVQPSSEGPAATSTGQFKGYNYHLLPDPDVEEDAGDDVPPPPPPPPPRRPCHSTSLCHVAVMDPDGGPVMQETDAEETNPKSL